MKKLLLALILSFAGILTAAAQDTIVKKNGDVLKVKVTEIGTEEIKFKTFGVTDGPIIVLKKSEVKKVVVGGQVIINEQEKPPVEQKTEDVLVRKDGTMLKIHVLEIGTSEVKFKLASDPDGPSISIDKSEIRTLTVGSTVVIDNKKESEDLIVKKDGSNIKAKVLEMGSDEVKYRLYGSPPDGPVLSLKKKDIKTVKIDDQVVYEYKPDPYSTSNNSILNKTNDLKFHFFSPLFNYLAFSYEWMEKPGFNWEAGAGVIGIGVSSQNENPFNGYHRGKPRGFFLRGGPKFLLGSGSDIEVEGARIAHPLKGRYFAIEGILQTMSRDYSLDTGYAGGYGTGSLRWERTYQSLVLNLIYGRQSIYGNVVTVGYYIGFGYGLENKTTRGNYPSNQYGYYDFLDVQRFSHIYLGRTFPFTFTWGLTIGYIHEKKKSVGNKSYKNNPRA